MMQLKKVLHHNLIRHIKRKMLFRSCWPNSCRWNSPSNHHNSNPFCLRMNCNSSPTHRVLRMSDFTAISYPRSNFASTVTFWCPVHKTGAEFKFPLPTSELHHSTRSDAFRHHSGNNILYIQNFWQKSSKPRTHPASYVISSYIAHYTPHNTPATCSCSQPRINRALSNWQWNPNNVGNLKPSTVSRSAIKPKHTPIQNINQ